MATGGVGPEQARLGLFYPMPLRGSGAGVGLLPLRLAVVASFASPCCGCPLFCGSSGGSGCGLPSGAAAVTSRRFFAAGASPRGAGVSPRVRFAERGGALAAAPAAAGAPGAYAVGGGSRASPRRRLAARGGAVTLAASSRSAFRLLAGCVWGPGFVPCGLALRLCRPGTGLDPLRGASCLEDTEAPPGFRPAACVWDPAPASREPAAWLCPSGSGLGPLRASPRRRLAARGGGVGARAPACSAFRLLVGCVWGPASDLCWLAFRLCRPGTGLDPLRVASNL